MNNTEKSPFDPDVVRASAIRQLKEMEDRHNFNRRVWFLRAVTNWELNKRENSTLVQPIPHPPLAVHYQYVMVGDPIVTEGPDLVAKPYTPPEPVVPVGGVVAFGPTVGDGSGRFLVAVANTVPPGTHTTREGIEYVLIQTGRPGQFMAARLWTPIGGE